MYDELNAFFERPVPFSVYTVDALWTDPHRAGQMLSHHLSETSNAASRRPNEIAAIVSWLDQRLKFAGKAITDLGCGPGLYTGAMAQRGGHVSGIDFSGNSIRYARGQAGIEGLDIAYEEADYLRDPLPADQDIVMLIYGDLCPLSPDRRRHLYDKVRKSLKPGGSFVFDVFSLAHFAALTESQGFEHCPEGGFWAKGAHFVFSKTFLYQDRHLGLDRYLVVTPDETHEVYNWMQYFGEDSIRAELAEAGFTDAITYDLTTGGPVQKDAKVFMVLART